MGISEKVRSLHCGFQQGLGFQIVDEESILLVKNVPYELENILSKWIAALPPRYMRDSNAFVKIVWGKELALTQTGWSAFVSWMVETLGDAQYKSEFTQGVEDSAKKVAE